VMVVQDKPIGMGGSWVSFNRFDDKGRIVLSGSPSAKALPDETKADLLDEQANGHLARVSATDGALSRYLYNPDDEGNAAGYLWKTFLLHGQAGIANPESAEVNDSPLQSTLTYKAVTLAAG